MIIINNDVVGIERDIKINYLKDNWNLTDKVYNLNNLLALENIEKIKDIRKEYSKLLKHVNSNNPNINKMLGNYRIKNKLISVKEKIELFQNRFNEKYEKVYNTRLELVNRINCSFINDETYKLPVYDNFSSVTGRTKIIDGYNFLVMKKQDRKNITSKFKGGRIYEIDIVSLEPRIACKLTRGEEYDDIYKHISKNVINSKNNRKNIKLGLISTLYGAKESTVKKLSGLNSCSVSLIKHWFGIKELYDELLDKYNIEKRITNFYGRNVYSGNALINHYIQSTAVDSAMIAFNNFMKKNKKGIDLIAIIHDAIIIDVHPSQINNIENTYSIYDHIMDIKMPVKVERLT
jgi:hypothetical protein